MKQFIVVRANGDVRGPFNLDVAKHFQAGYDDKKTIAELDVNIGMKDSDGDTWVRIADLHPARQDDVPLTATDVVEARTSASRVRQSLRLERIATATMAAIISKLPVMITEPSDTEACKRTARGALKYAQALIAELDKQA